MMPLNQTKTILIVDDEINYGMIEFLHFFKSNFNFEVLTAENLYEAKTKVLENSVDCIILDMLFPDCGFDDKKNISTSNNENKPNGLVFLKFLRENEALNKIPVICLTHSSYEEVGKEINELNAIYIQRRSFRSMEEFEKIVISVINPAVQNS